MTIATKHNGGRSQVNPYFPWYSAQHNFLNIVKHGGNFANKSDNITVDIAVRDANGWPTSGSYYSIIAISNDPAVLDASWTMKWDGSGQVDIPGPIQSLGPGTTQINSQRASSGNGGGSVTFTKHPTLGKDFYYGAHSTAAFPNHVRNMKIFLTSETAREAAGEWFSAKYLERLREANFGVIRFLDWQGGNGSNVTTWATRKPVDYLSWSGTELRTSLYCGATTNAGNDYSITGNGIDVPSSGPPAHNTTLIVKFNANGTGAATLSLNGTTARPILNIYCGPLTQYSIHYPLANRFGTLVYDADLQAYIKHGGDSEGFDTGLTSGVPPEVMIRLCAEVGAHPYFVTPHRSIDPATDYMIELAKLCRDTGPSWMVPRFEGPNETWNTFAGFQATPYANAKAVAYGWGANGFHDWYGKAMSVLGQAVANVYSVAQADVKTQRKYQILCGVQTALSGDSAFAPRLTSPKYILQTPQAGYLASAAKNWATHIALAQYMNASIQGGATETTLRDAFAGVRFKAGIVNGAMTVTGIDTSGGVLAIGKTVFGRGVGNGLVASGVTIVSGSAPNWVLSDNTLNGSGTFYAATDVTAVDTYVSYLVTGSTNFNLVHLANIYSAWKAFAATHGVKMSGYEGGFSPDYITSSADAVNVLRYAAKLVPAMKAHLLTNYRTFLSAGGEYPSMYHMGADYPSATAWGVLEDLWQSPNPPQWEAVREFNAEIATVRLKV